MRLGGTKLNDGTFSPAEFKYKQIDGLQVIGVLYDFFLFESLI